MEHAILPGKKVFFLSVVRRSWECKFWKFYFGGRNLYWQATPKHEAIWICDPWEWVWYVDFIFWNLLNVDA